MTVRHYYLSDPAFELVDEYGEVLPHNAYYYDQALAEVEALLMLDTLGIVIVVRPFSGYTWGRKAA